MEIVLGKNYTDTLRRKVLRTVMEDFRNEKIQKWKKQKNKSHFIWATILNTETNYMTSIEDSLQICEHEYLNWKWENGKII